jgi:hypothetical protein
MNPASELLLAYLRKAQDQVVTLRRQRDDLQSNLRNMRISRDQWREKAKARRLALKNMSASRDLWRHRALTASAELGLVRRGVVEVNVRRSMVGRDLRDDLSPLHPLADGEVRLDVPDPVDAPAVGLEVDRGATLR